MKIFNNKYVRFSLILIGGILLGGYSSIHLRPKKKNTTTQQKRRKARSGPALCTHRYEWTNPVNAPFARWI